MAVALRLARRPLGDIQAFLGHRSLQTTATVYSTPNAVQLAQLLRLPWLPTQTGDGADELLHALSGQ